MKIDNKDILSTWGVTLLEGSYNSLFKYPQRTPVEFTNYAEQDGIQPNVRKISFQPKQVALNFAMEADTLDEFYYRYNQFYYDITAPGGYRTADLESGLTHQLRYDTASAYEMPTAFNAGKNLTSFTLNFIEDNHAIPSTQFPIGGIPLRGLYAVNGIDFGAFGIHPDGEIGDVLKYPDMKAPFTNTRNIDHRTYRLKHKELTIKLWMLAESKTEFINNYAAFFNQFNRTGLVPLYIKEIGGTTEVYYTGCSGFDITWGSRIGVKFSINVVVPVVTWLDGGGTTILLLLRDMGTGLVLADEQGQKIVFNKAIRYGR